MSDSEARTLLRSKWQQAQQRDSARFCADADTPESCRRAWDDAGGGAAVPTDEPRIVATNAARDQRWLTVCGVTGLGTSFQGDFVVESFGTGVRPLLPVFWRNVNYAGVFSEGSEPTRTTTSHGPSLC